MYDIIEARRNARKICICPDWDTAGDFDGPEDYRDACADCPIHN